MQYSSIRLTKLLCPLQYTTNQVDKLGWLLLKMILKHNKAFTHLTTPRISLWSNYHNSMMPAWKPPVSVPINGFLLQYHITETICLMFIYQVSQQGFQKKDLKHEKVVSWDWINSSEFLERGGSLKLHFLTRRDGECSSFLSIQIMVTVWHLNSALGNCCFKKPLVGLSLCNQYQIHRNCKL